MTKTRKEILTYLNDTYVTHVASTIEEQAVARSIIQQLSNGGPVLNLWNSKLEPLSMGPLLYVLMHDTNIKELDVGYNQGMGNVGIERLSAALANNTSLESFSIRNNELTDEQVGLLTKSLTSHQNIHTLILNSNVLGLKSAEHIAEMLKSNQKLASLDLHRCLIGNDGVKLIADALIDNTTLQCLHLTENNLTSQGCQYLSTALETNFTVQRIAIGVDPIPANDPRYLQVETALKRNVGITKALQASLQNFKQKPGFGVFFSALASMETQYGIFSDVEGNLLEKTARLFWKEQITEALPTDDVSKIREELDPVITSASYSWVNKLKQEANNPKDIGAPAR